VLVDNKKMSKSLGNVFLVNGKYNDTGFWSFEEPPVLDFSSELKEKIIKKYKELKMWPHHKSQEVVYPKPENLDETQLELIFWDNFKFDPLAYRLMMFEHHYSEQMNFTWEKLWQSQMRLWGIRKEVAKVHSYFLDFNPQNLQPENFDELKNEWLQIIVNNLNFSEFLDLYQKTLLNLSNSIKDQKFNNTIYFLLSRFDKDLLQLKLWEDVELSKKDQIWEIGKKRQAAKLDKDWQKADQLRSEIQNLGFQIDDYNWGFGLWWRGDVY
jgi:cysteinyl-tRNA synthetase